MADTVRKMVLHDIPLLRRFLEQKLPLSLPMLSLIRVEEEYRLSRKIFVTDPDPTLFIFARDILSGLPSFCVFWDSSRMNKTSVTSCLKRVPEWNWNQNSFVLCRVPEILASQLSLMITDKEITSVNLQPIPQPISYLLHRQHPSQQGLKKLPKGLRTGELKPHHTEYILSYSDYPQSEDFETFKQHLKILPSVAIYKEDTDNNHNPVAWILLNSFGALGMLYITPTFRRHGLATILIQSLFKKLENVRFPINGEVEIQNKSALMLNQKLGNRNVGIIQWQTFKSKTELDNRQKL